MFSTFLAARIETKAWRDGYVKSAENYMKSGDWCTMPKQSSGVMERESGPRYVPLED